MKERRWLTAWPWLTMMPERIGIIGKTQGVSDSSRPKPKKLRSTSARLSPLNRPAMREVSSPVAVFSSVPEVGAGDTAVAAAAGAVPAAGISMRAS